MISERNIMIDIETLGNAKNSVILSIGAVEFNMDGVIGKFYIQVDPESCQRAGLVIDARTVMWWMDKPDVARRSLCQPGGANILDALSGLANAFDWKGVDVWANGMDFDLGILEEAYKTLDEPVPWDYWRKCDYRTLKRIVPEDVYKAAKTDNPVAHHALSDAICQAATLIKLLQWIHRDDVQEKKRA